MSVVGGMSPRVYTSQLYRENQLQAEKSRGGPARTAESTDVASFSPKALELAGRLSDSSVADAALPAASVAITRAAADAAAVRGGEPQTDVSAGELPPGYKGIDFIA